MYVVYIWKWSSAYALGGVSGVESFITTDEQLQYNRGCCFLVQAMLPAGFLFQQFNETENTCVTVPVIVEVFTIRFFYLVLQLQRPQIY